MLPLRHNGILRLSSRVITHSARHSNPSTCTHTQPIKLCIIGGGLAGMASAFYASKDPRRIDITVYDIESDAGLGGASSAPVTLLHPLTPKGKIMWRGLEGFQSMLDIMKETGYCCQETQVDKRIIRLFFDEKKFDKYKRQLDKYPHMADILDAGTCKKLYPSSCSSASLQSIVGGVQIHQSRIIDTPLYLRGIWKYVLTHAHKATWKQQKVENLKALQDSCKYDVILVCCGDDSERLWKERGECTSSSNHAEKLQINIPQSSQALSLHHVKGQTITLRDPLYKSEVPQTGLSYALLCGEYVIPHPTKPGYLLCGATKEHQASPTSHAPSGEPAMTTSHDSASAMQHLMPKLARLYPPLNETPVSNDGVLWTATRVIANRPHVKGHSPLPPRLPLLVPHSDINQCWLLTALGSRGLIHHTVAAQCAIAAILPHDNEDKINSSRISVPIELGLTGT